MKRRDIFFTVPVLAVVFFSTVAIAQSTLPWEVSPYNWRNSPYNYDNSAANFLNSPYNVANREGQRGRINIVNLLGIVTGYAVIKKDGGINYFDNEGKRLGYSNDGGVTQYDVEGETTTFRTEVEE
jgi:hypothetical protein